MQESKFPPKTATLKRIKEFERVGIFLKSLMVPFTTARYPSGIGLGIIVGFKSS